MWLVFFSSGSSAWSLFLYEAVTTWMSRCLHWLSCVILHVKEICVFQTAAFADSQPKTTPTLAQYNPHPNPTQPHPTPPHSHYSAKQALLSSGTYHALLALLFPEIYSYSSSRCHCKVKRLNSFQCFTQIPLLSTNTEKSVQKIIMSSFKPWVIWL